MAPGSDEGRFPGFNVLDQSRHWDQVTAGVVLSRVGRAPDITFFTPAEQALVTSLCHQLLGGDGDDPGGDPLHVAVVNLIDQRLSAQQTDGWRYEDMPSDEDAWRLSLVALDQDASSRFGVDFTSCSWEQQAALVQAVQDLEDNRWHGMCAEHVWSLWTRYACTAFYSHPAAWNEIGFPGPAYPRGYKNRGVDVREPFEVRDARPHADPVRHRS
ncbi:MAG: gluconate 2-dehydrogenase subunit 3 family protein [Marmoricola sp.]